MSWACSSSSGSWPTCRCRASTGTRWVTSSARRASCSCWTCSPAVASRRFSIIALGVNPYINASIIMQLMTGVVPRLQQLQREGEYGRNKINQYTRYLTVPMALLQSYGYLAILSGQTAPTGSAVIPTSTWRRFETLTMIATLTAGSVLLMWIGELITERGIGNGISFIIFAGIVARAPNGLLTFLRTPDWAAGLAFARDGGRGGRGHRVHPGRPAAHPHPVRQPRPRQADVPGRRHVPAAARQPGRRDPDHLRGQHPALPGPARPVLLELVRGRHPGHQQRRHRVAQQPGHRCTWCCTSC